MNKFGTKGWKPSFSPRREAALAVWTPEEIDEPMKPNALPGIDDVGWLSERDKEKIEQAKRKRMRSALGTEWSIEPFADDQYGEAQRLDSPSYAPTWAEDSYAEAEKNKIEEMQRAQKAFVRASPPANPYPDWKKPEEPTWPGSAFDPWNSAPSAYTDGEKMKLQNLRAERAGGHDDISSPFGAPAPKMKPGAAAYAPAAPGYQKTPLPDKKPVAKSHAPSAPYKKETKALRKEPDKETKAPRKEPDPAMAPAYAPPEPARVDFHASPLLVRGADDEAVGQAPRPAITAMMKRPRNRVRMEYATEKATGARGYFVVGEPAAGLIVTGAQRVGPNAWYVAPGMTFSVEGPIGKGGAGGYYIKEAVFRR